MLAPNATLVDAANVGAWTAALHALLADPVAARAAGDAARAATRELTWERTARLTADVYREFAR